LINAINGNNFTYELYEDRKDIQIWKNWRGSKDNVFVIDRCGNVVANVSTFGEQVRLGFETAYFNNQTAGMETACICDIYNDENDGEEEDDDDEDEDDDDEDDEEDEDEDDDEAESIATSPSPLVDMSNENKLS